VALTFSKRVSPTNLLVRPGQRGAEAVELAAPVLLERVNRVLGARVPVCRGAVDHVDLASAVGSDALLSPLPGAGDARSSSGEATQLGTDVCKQKGECVNEIQKYFGVFEFTISDQLAVYTY
jgi:hypothetical protein